MYTSSVLVKLIVVIQVSNGAFYEYDKIIEEEIQCQCVPPHLCSDNDFAHGNDLLDIRMEDESCANLYEVCCENPITEETHLPIKSCGLANIQEIVPRVTANSEITEFGELPWTILILHKERSPERNRFICGGSLVHPQVVVTAGHCVSSTSVTQILVRAGEWNIRNRGEPIGHQEARVREIMVHPQYKPSILWNDIALLFLEEPFYMAENVGFICLPSPNLKLDYNHNCIASGWGRNTFQSVRHSTILRKVGVPLVARSKCQTLLRTTRLGKFYKLHRSFICAGGERNKDTCKGDGGSPLICPIPGQQVRFVQVGIVSWGIGCGAGRTPGVYVNLALFVNWIDEQMLKSNFNSSYYKY